MKHYEIYSAISNGNFMDDEPIYSAEAGRKALEQHLKVIGFKGKVKASASRDVHFKTTPIHIDENGRKWIDRRNGQRSVWYQILPTN